MKKLFFTKAFLLVTMLFLCATASFGQDPFVVTDDQPFIEDFSGGNVFDYWTMESVGAGHWSVMLGSTGNYGETWRIDETVAVKAVVTPNPTHDHVVIATNATNGKVTLFDLWGRQVVSATLFEGRAEIDASGLAPGIYTAHVASEEGIATVRLIKE